ncbi:MAG: glutaredoxin [Gammaproteobacteria bacterium]|jgi:glutaredoxin
MKYFFKFVRMILRPVILFIDRLTRPAWPERSRAQQKAIDEKTSNLALYQFHACPFCIITRRTMLRLGLNIELRDAQNDPQWGQELIEQGGKRQVPCLRINREDGKVEWLYESSEIKRYLERQYGDTT